MPDTDPRVWARGKTATEVLGIADQMAGALQSYVRGPQAPALAAAPVSPQGPNEQDYVTGADLNRFAPRVIEQHVQPQFNAMANNLAGLALDQVKREYAREFERFGPTINANLAQLTDKTQWTVDNLRKMVKYSLIDHVDELARDRATQLTAEMPVALRSNGVASPAVAPNAEHTIQAAETPDYWRKLAQEAGVDERTVDEFCYANGISRQEFFAQFKNRGIITEVGALKRG